MDRESMAGGSSRPAWSGRAKPRPLVARKQVATKAVRKYATGVRTLATKAARKSAPGPRVMTSSQSEEQETQEEEEEPEDGTKVVRKSAPGPRAMIMTSSQNEDKESHEQQQDTEAEEDEVEEEEEEEDSESVSEDSQQECWTLEEKSVHSWDCSEEDSEDKEGKEESPDKEVRVHEGVKAAMKRAPAPIECKEHKFSDLKFQEKEAVCSLGLKLQRFLDAGTSFVDEIEGMQGKPVTSAVMNVAEDMVSKSFQHSARLVKALLRLKRDKQRKRKPVVAVEIPPREPLNVGEVETVAAKKQRRDT